MNSSNTGSVILIQGQQMYESKFSLLFPAVLNVLAEYTVVELQP